jgi:hypothetical protein
MAQTEVINRNMGSVKAIDGGVGALDDGEEYMGNLKVLAGTSPSQRNCDDTAAAAMIGE